MKIFVYMCVCVLPLFLKQKNRNSVKANTILPSIISPHSTYYIKISKFLCGLCFYAIHIPTDDIQMIYSTARYFYIFYLDDIYIYLPAF